MPKDGEDIYNYIGPLTERDTEYLDDQVNDTRRRIVLNNWYGRAGAQFAWKEYKRRKVGPHE